MGGAHIDIITGGARQATPTTRVVRTTTAGATRMDTAMTPVGDISPSDHNQVDGPEAGPSFLTACQSCLPGLPLCVLSGYLPRSRQSGRCCASKTNRVLRAALLRRLQMAERQQQGDVIGDFQCTAGDERQAREGRREQRARERPPHPPPTPPPHPGYAPASPPP